MKYLSLLVIGWACFVQISIAQNTREQITSLYNKGHAAIYKQSNGAEGMRYMLQVKQLAQQNGDSLHYHLALYHLGVIEAEDRHYLDVSQRHFEEAYRYFIKIPAQRQLCAEIILNRIFNLTNLKQYDKLLIEVDTLNKLISDYPALDSAYRYFYLREKAHTLVLLKRLDEAYPLLVEETSLLIQQQPQPDRQCFNYYFWGLYYKYRSNCQKSIQYFRKSVDIAYQIKDNGIIREGSREIADCYTVLGNYKSAYQHQKIYAEYNEKRRIKETKQVQALSQEIVNQNEKIAKQEKQVFLTEKSKAEQKALNARIQIMLLVILFGLAIIVFFLFHKSRQRKLDALNLEIKLSNNKLIIAENEQNLALTKSLLEGQEQERKRISAELHDSIGGLLSQLRYLLNEKSTQKNNTIVSIIDELFNEVRSIGTDLYSPHLQRFSLEQLIGGYCQKYQQKGTSIVQFEYSGEPVSISESVKVHLFRIVQEAVSNAIRHSKAEIVIVQLIYSTSGLSIIIEDNGIGFATSPQQSGTGLQNIKNRAKFIGAELSIDTTSVQGVSIQLHWG
jgi:two-component system NarL family sensor kinase